MLFFIGIPIFFLELSIGQFISRGPLHAFRHSLILKGIGISMMIISAMVALYYHIILAWVALYLVKSLTSILSWSKCNPELNIFFCESKRNIVDNCLERGFQKYPNGTCYDGYKFIGLISKKMNDTQYNLPAEGYFLNDVLGVSQPKHLFDFVALKWQIILSVLILWVIVFAAIFKGIKLSVKVVYLTAFFSHLILVILFIRAMALNGSLHGVRYYLFNMKWNALLTSAIWKDAAVQILFTLSVAILVPLINFLTSLLAGFVIFGFIGHLAFQLNISVNKVVTVDVSLAFIVVPATIIFLEASPQCGVSYMHNEVSDEIDGKVSTFVTGEYKLDRKKMEKLDGNQEIEKFLKNETLRKHITKIVESADPMCLVKELMTEDFMFAKFADTCIKTIHMEQGKILSDGEITESESESGKTTLSNCLAELTEPATYQETAGLRHKYLQENSYINIENSCIMINHTDGDSTNVRVDMPKGFEEIPMSHVNISQEPNEVRKIFSQFIGSIYGNYIKRSQTEELEMITN
ncbi:hypothetical protein A3Q56_07034 [Intoshia linei]|uniref:Uncharacterized protein n=1 Tax=Intoshia linei TaxID=1819745 RepID=A0A177AV11_9BILA|nr:hypothetical protein A3Q56_07034 [Intoshia linei]